MLPKGDNLYFSFKALEWSLSCFQTVCLTITIALPIAVIRGQLKIFCQFGIQILIKLIDNTEIFNLILVNDYPIISITCCLHLYLTSSDSAPPTQADSRKPSRHGRRE